MRGYNTKGAAQGTLAPVVCANHQLEDKDESKLMSMSRSKVPSQGELLHELVEYHANRPYAGGKSTRWSEIAQFYTNRKLTMR